MKAMTFTETSPERGDLLIDDDAWALEPKYDGVRCMVSIEDGRIELHNRNGAPLSAASTNAHRSSIAASFTGFNGTWVFDGELLEDGTLIVFDLPYFRVPDLTLIAPPPFSDRRMILENVAYIRGWGDPHTNIRLATHVTGSDKRVLFDTIAETGGEGVMLKHLDASYESRRTKSAGFKVKFTSTVDAIIIDRNTDGKENAELAVVDPAGQLIRIGHCSMIGKPAATVGDVVEVTYLYVGANGKLVQPRLTRVRGDKAAAECTFDQLDGKSVNKWVDA